MHSCPTTVSDEKVTFLGRGKVRTYSDPSYIFSGGQDPSNPQDLRPWDQPIGQGLQGPIIPRGEGQNTPCVIWACQFPLRHLPVTASWSSSSERSLRSRVSSVSPLNGLLPAAPQNDVHTQIYSLKCHLVVRRIFSYYAALLPRRGPHIASHSVCPSVCPSVPLSLPLVTSFRQPLASRRAT